MRTGTAGDAAGVGRRVLKVQPMVTIYLNAVEDILEMQSKLARDLCRWDHR